MFNNKILSIDIGNKNINIAVGQKLGSSVTINSLKIIPTPKDSFEDGEILNLEFIKSSIKNFLDLEKIRVGKIVFTIQSTSVIIRDVILPYAKEEELKSMVNYEISDYLPIELNDYVIEYKVLDYIQEGKEKKAKILVAALPKSIVDNYLKLSYDLKLKPYIMDLSFNAMTACFDSNNTDTIAVIDLGHRFIEITVIANGVIEFSRLINHGARELDLSIANYFNLTLEEAERVKKEYSINKLDESNTSAALKEVVKESLNLWMIEIDKIFQFYMSRNASNKIDSVYIHGGSAKLQGLCQYFNEYFEIPAFTIKDINGIKTVKNIDIDYDCFLNCIGGIMKS